MAFGRKEVGLWPSAHYLLWGWRHAEPPLSHPYKGCNNAYLWAGTTNGYKVSFRDGENILKLGYSDGCTTLEI